MLDDDIRNVFKQHIKDRGLITAPEKLLRAVLSEVSAWLKDSEQAYRKAGQSAEAKASRELRARLRKTT